jgi:integrase
MPRRSRTRSSPTLDSLYADFFEPLALRSRRPNTKRLYRTTLRYFSLYLGRPAIATDLNDATVSRFAASRLADGLAKRSVNKDLFNLLAIWRWLHKKGYVKTWPDVSLETPPVRVPIALTREELARVTAAIKLEKANVGFIAGPQFWLALFLVIWNTGERIGAVMALTWEQVDLTNGWIRFIAEDRKGAAADNALPIADYTIAALKEIKKTDGIVFRWPYSPTYIYRRVAKIMLRAGLPDNRNYKFHVIRKSVASHYEAAGGNATELLGHTSRKVTRAYLDPRIVKAVSAIDLLFRPGA